MPSSFASLHNTVRHKIEGIEKTRQNVGWHKKALDFLKWLCNTAIAATFLSNLTNINCNSIVKYARLICQFNFSCPSFCCWLVNSDYVNEAPNQLAQIVKMVRTIANFWLCYWPKMNLSVALPGQMYSL